MTPREALDILAEHYVILAEHYAEHYDGWGGEEATALATIEILVERHEALRLTDAERRLVDAIGSGEPGWINSLDTQRVLGLLDRAFPKEDA